MAEKRKADALAGKGGFSDMLRKRRMAIEEGDPSGGGAFDSFNQNQEKTVTDPRPQVIVEGYKPKR